MRSFDGKGGGWRLKMRGGEEVFANVLVSGTGQLNRPHIPAIAGLEGFAGSWFHSARWNHNLDLAGRRIAVVGNGASAIQFIPQIARTAQRVMVFQHSANWILPRNDRPYTAREKWIFRRVPLAMRLYRRFIYLGLEATFLGFFPGSWLGRQIEKHPAKHAVPRRRPASPRCADARLSRWLQAHFDFRRLLPGSGAPKRRGGQCADRFHRADGVATADGVLRRADVLVFATGFQASSFLAPMRIEGLTGGTLEETWREGAEAHLGIAVSGFPNLFLLYGPNTNLGHNSILFMIECQANYVVRCIRELARAKLRWLDVRPEAMTHFNASLQRELQKTAWGAGCTNWYKTRSGKITNNWPGFTFGYWWRTRRPAFVNFERRP